MAEVFDRYPGGGTELLLALAIADHAHDDGTHVFPSVKRLAEKTRQSERSVQYHLRTMEANAWLQLVAHESGGRGKAREYRISPDWIKGADFSQAQKGAVSGVKGCSPAQERVQPSVEKGATAIAPEPPVTIKEPSEPPKARKRALPGEDYPTPPWVPRDLWLDWLEVRRKKRAPSTDRALELSLDDLHDFMKAGEDVAAILKQSIKRSWTGLFTTRNRGHESAGNHGGGRESEASRVERINREHDERERAAGLM